MVSIPRAQCIPIGAVFGRLTVIGERTTKQRIGYRASAYPVRCECGTEKIIGADELFCGTRSCGCLVRDGGSKPHKWQQIHVGDIFGRLTVIGPVVNVPKAPPKEKYFHRAFPCRCACGIEVVVLAGNLLKDRPHSCGCSRVDSLVARFTTHGGTNTPLYGVWCGIRGRCTNPNEVAYPDYGGRGIYVEPVWDDFAAFRSWALEHGYKKGMHLDRIDNDGPYGPNNCRFVTAAVNKRNTRAARLVTAFGETRNLVDWVPDPRCRVGRRTLSARIAELGWDAERAITTPPLYPGWRR